MVDSTKLSLLGIYLSIFAHTLMYATLFPVLGELSLDFNKPSPKSDLGKWFSKLNGGFYLGEFLCFPLQIWLCSKFRPRSLHLFSIGSTAFFSILMAYSTTYDSLVVLRFFQGLCCPVFYSAYKCLRVYFPHSPEKSENFVSRFFLLGLFFGFFIGGFFYDKSFLGSNKYLASNFIVAFVAIISFALCLKYGKDGEQEDGGSILMIFIEIIEAFKTPGFLFTLVAYLLCCVAAVGFDLMILFMLSETSQGGYNFEIRDLYKVLSVYSILMLIFIFVYQKEVINKYGLIQGSKESLKLCFLCFIVFPIFSLSKKYYIAKIMTMSLISFMYMTPQYIAEHATLNIIRSISDESSGITCKDLALGLNKFTKSLSIYLFSLSFTDHIKNEDYPFNYSYTFNVMALIILFTYFICFFLRQTESLPVSKPPKAQKVRESLLDPSSETLEIPVKNNELKELSSNK